MFKSSLPLCVVPPFWDTNMRLIDIKNMFFIPGRFSSRFLPMIMKMMIMDGVYQKNGIPEMIYYADAVYGRATLRTP
jgi:hypothetical protein